MTFFFALGGGAIAGVKYLTTSDPITQGDLAGSTYGNPLIANGKVTTAKIADGAITPAKFSAPVVGVVTITSNETFTTPAGVHALYVECVGGGGHVGVSGTGGSSHFGGGAFGRTDSPGAGAAGHKYGGGGSGAFSGGDPYAGGPGAPGVVVVWEFA